MRKSSWGFQLSVFCPSSHLLSFIYPPLHCRHLVWPEFSILPSSPHCGNVLAALWGKRGLEEEEEAKGLVCLRLLERAQEVCQETCAMSLTRVWMSWRQRGHVSNCKAHSIHIPLGKRDGTKSDCSCLRSEQKWTWVSQTFYWQQKNTYPCPQGRSSVSAMTSQHSVQQLSRMLTCLIKARRRCLGNTHTNTHVTFLYTCRCTVCWGLFCLRKKKTGHTHGQFSCNRSFSSRRLPFPQRSKSMCGGSDWSESLHSFRAMHFKFKIIPNYLTVLWNKLS